MNTKISRIVCCLTLSLWFSFTLLAQSPQDDPDRTLTPEEIVTGQLMALISDWAGTWQAQLPDLFISHYELDYVAPGFSTRQAWLDDRRSKLVEPEYIKLRLIDFELVSLTETAAITRFNLIYERPGYTDETLKELVFANNNGLWLIREENNLRVIPR